MTPHIFSTDKMQLTCLFCVAALQEEEVAMRCESCQRSWPIISGIPILMADPALYARHTLARAEIAKAKAFKPFTQAFENAKIRMSELDPNQISSLLQAANATKENFEIFDRLLHPLQTRFTQNEPFDVDDLDPRSGGYGPPATLEYLLRDWRKDTQESDKSLDLYLPNKNHERAIVLGSGAGRALAGLSAHAGEVIGVDLSYLLAHTSNLICRGEQIKINEVRIRNVRQMSDRITVHQLGDGYSRTNIRMLIADAVHCPLPDACADIVIAAFLFDLMTDGRILLKEMRRLLRPGGQAILLTVFAYEQEDLWTYYTPEQVIDLFKAYELNIDDVSWFQHSYLSSPRSILNYRYDAMRIIARG